MKRDILPATLQRISGTGFTLAELMISIAVGSFFAVGVFKLIRSHAQNSTDQITVSQNSRASQRARAVLMSDVEEAGFDPRYIDLGRSAVTPLTAASNDSFATQGDFNLNGQIDLSGVSTPETVSYQYDASNNQLTRNGSTFLTGVLSFAVTYYNDSGTSATSVGSGSAIASLSQVKKMRIQWTQAGEGSRTLAQEIVVILRNFH